MKYVLMLLAIAAAYYILGRNTPVAPVAKAITAQEVVPLTTGPRAPSPPPESNSLKRPLDRTHTALDQVKRRNGNGEF